MPRTPPRPPLAPRKSPRQQRSGETVATIVEAAAQVLEAEGFAGYNTNAIAARAGVSVGSLYQYFPSKDALTVALMRREEARFEDESIAAFGRGDARDALAAFIDAAVRQQLARPRLARLLDIEETRPEIERVMGGKPGLRAHLERVLAGRELPPQADVVLAASDLSAIVRGLTDRAGERGETDLAGLERRIAAAVFGYLERMAVPIATRNASPPRKRRRSSA